MEMASKTLQSPKVAVLRKVVLPQSAEPNQTVQKGSNQARDEWRHYRGVRPRKPRKFGAEIQVNGKQVWLGTYKTKIKAARAYDEAALKFHRSKAILNFPPDNKKEEGSNQARDEQRHYRGVQERPGRKFRARIRDPSQNGKQVWLGTYKTKIDAARAYNEAALKYHRKPILNFLPDGKEEEVEGDNDVKKEEVGKKRRQETTVARADGKKRHQETTPRGGGGGDNEVIVKKEEVDGDLARGVGGGDNEFIVKKEEVEGDLA